MSSYTLAIQRPPRPSAIVPYFDKGPVYENTVDTSLSIIHIDKFVEYIRSQGGSIQMAGPPTLKGSLAHFYKLNPEIAILFKNYRVNSSKEGINSVLYSFSDRLSSTTIGPNNMRAVIENGNSIGNHREFALDNSFKSSIEDALASLRGIRSLVDKLERELNSLAIK